jgi:hypothetical protein
VILVGFVIALVINIIVQHFGKIGEYGSYAFFYNDYYIGNILRSPFGYDYQFSKDVISIDYVGRFGIYIIASFSKFQYILYIWIPISAILYFFKKYKLSIK